LVDFGMRANMPRTSDRHVNEKPFRIALNLRESPSFYPLNLQKIEKLYIPQKTKKTEVIEGPPAEVAKKLVDKLRNEVHVL